MRSKCEVCGGEFGDDEMRSWIEVPIEPLSFDGQTYTTRAAPVHEKCTKGSDT